MKIQPLGNLVQLDIAEATAGVLDTSSRDTAVEFAEVIAIGPDLSEDPRPTALKVGDKVFVKAWGVDIVNHQDKKYYFVDMTNGALLAIVKDE